MILRHNMVILLIYEDSFDNVIVLLLQNLI